MLVNGYMVGGLSPVYGIETSQVRVLLSRFTELAVKAKKNHITRKTLIFVICVFWFCRR
nr:MAG TPA: hypothetical protein [Caudoviricetes sp.]